MSPLSPPIFRTEMKRVVWFETDLGFEATRQQLRKQRDIIGDMETYKGILTFYVKDLKDYTVQITTKGKLGISYPESANYQIVLEKLKPLLVRPDGSPIRKLEQIKIAEAKKPSTEKPSRFRYWIPELIVFILIGFFSIVLPIGFIDPSLKLLNDTIINPLKAIGPYALFPLLALILYAMLKSRRDSE